jgi:hypothetical protein
MSNMDERVKRKLDDEYRDYMKRVTELPAWKILKNLDKIAAMKDVYAYLTEYGDLDGRETEWLLSADNPLRRLRDQWLYNDKDISDSLNQALWNLCDPQELSGDDEDEYEGG